MPILVNGRVPPPSPPISASKYPVFMALRDVLPRKYLKGHIVACRNKTTNGLEAGAGDREPWIVNRGPRSGGTALPASLKAYGNSVRREGEILCKMAAGNFLCELGVGSAFELSLRRGGRCGGGGHRAFQAI